MQVNYKYVQRQPMPKVIKERESYGGARNVTSFMCTRMHCCLISLYRLQLTATEVYISIALASAKGQSDDRIPSGWCTCCYIPHVYTHACIACYTVCRKYMQSFMQQKILSRLVAIYKELVIECELIQSMLV